MVPDGRIGRRPQDGSASFPGGGDQASCALARQVAGDPRAERCGVVGGTCLHADDGRAYRWDLTWS
jgi:hypothetical protein